MVPLHFGEGGTIDEVIDDGLKKMSQRHLVRWDRCGRRARPLARPHCQPRTATRSARRMWRGTNPVLEAVHELLRRALRPGCCRATGSTAAPILRAHQDQARELLELLHRHALPPAAAPPSRGARRIMKRVQHLRRHLRLFNSGSSTSTGNVPRPASARARQSWTPFQDYWTMAVL